jgi:hypothetical protein
VDILPAQNAGVARRLGRRTTILVSGCCIAGTAIAWSVSAVSGSPVAPCEVSQLAPVQTLAEVAYTGPQGHEPVFDVGRAAQQSHPVASDWIFASQAGEVVSRSVAERFGRTPEIPINGLGRINRPSDPLPPVHDVLGFQCPRGVVIGDETSRRGEIEPRLLVQCETGVPMCAAPGVDDRHSRWAWMVV